MKAKQLLLIWSILSFCLTSTLAFAGGPVLDSPQTPSDIIIIPPYVPDANTEPAGQLKSWFGSSLLFFILLLANLLVIVWLVKLYKKLFFA
jgi:hypothetical protein